MKVCVFTTVHRPFDVRVFHKQARSLAKAGHKVTLIVHADFDKKEIDGVLVKGVKKPGIRILRILNIFRFAQLCLCEKADVFHFHDFELLPIGLFLKFITKKRVIYDCHENFPEAVYERVWYPDWLKPILSQFIAGIEPAIARRLDAVVCVVPDQKVRFDAKSCRTLMVRNVPLLEQFDNALDKKQPKENRIIYLGALTLVRGARVIVEIMEELHKLLPNVKLLHLGRYNEPHVEKETKAYIAEKHLQNVIEHIPLVPHEEVPEYVVRSQLGLIPWQEHQQMLKMISPNKVFEYMACGLPVVASDLPSLKYIIGRSKSGVVVKSDDPKAHANAIAELLASPETLGELGQNGRNFVKEYYNWTKEANNLLELYKSFGV